MERKAYQIRYMLINCSIDSQCVPRFSRCFSLTVSLSLSLFLLDSLVWAKLLILSFNQFGKDKNSAVNIHEFVRCEFVLIHCRI